MSAEPVPVILVTGVDDAPMSASTIGLQFDVPSAVVVRHRIEHATSTLHRTVSDASGVLEEEVVDLEHACATCAIREDVVPTIERLAELGRWRTILVHLPVAAEALQVCRVLAAGGGHGTRVAAVVAAFDGPTLDDVLTGGDDLASTGRGVAADDDRGVAEVACGLVEYADVVEVHGYADPAAMEMARALARPGATVGDGGLAAGPTLAAGVHRHAATEAWVDELRSGFLGPEPGEGVWRLDLRSDRPFDPARLDPRIELLGGGRHRSRGCFQLPTRPMDACGWDGAGGHVSIGTIRHWGKRPPHTRLVLTGLTEHADADAVRQLAEVFGECLVTDGDLSARGRFWEVTSDGFEPWLGGIRGVA